MRERESERERERESATSVTRIRHASKIDWAMAKTAGLSVSKI